MEENPIVGRVLVLQRLASALFMKFYVYVYVILMSSKLVYLPRKKNKQIKQHHDICLVGNWVSELKWNHRGNVLTVASLLQLISWLSIQYLPWKVVFFLVSLSILKILDHRRRFFGLIVCDKHWKYAVQYSIGMFRWQTLSFDGHLIVHSSHWAREAILRFLNNAHYFIEAIRNYT